MSSIRDLENPDGNITGTIGLDPNLTILWAQVNEGQPQMSIDSDLRLRPKGIVGNSPIYLGDVGRAALRSLGPSDPPMFEQLPAYDEAYDRFKGLGVDEVYCVSVNDGFVMNAWADSLGVKNVKLLADGNGDFTQSIGVSVNKRHLGFGPRSWRYSLYVINGIVDQAFIEPGFNQTGEDDDPYTCSDPETIINYIQTTLR